MLSHSVHHSSRTDPALLSCLASSPVQREVLQNGFGLPGNPPVQLPKQVRLAWGALSHFCLPRRWRRDEVGGFASCHLVRVASQSRCMLSLRHVQWFRRCLPQPGR